MSARPIENVDLSKISNRLMGQKYAPEADVVRTLLADNKVSDQALDAIEVKAAEIVTLFRSQSDKHSMLDAFLQEYGLSNKEGISLMCLAEALLRVPDKATRDDLIADKIAPGDWASHLGNASTLFVNASTWGLMLTGRVTSMGEKDPVNPETFIGHLTNKLGEPIIRKAVVKAMRILGGEFVLGETIDKAIKRGRKLFSKDQIYSFDMLGEGARTAADAERYFDAYKSAIRQTAKMQEKGDVFARSGVSVKLSALYPRYEFAQRDDVILNIGDKLTELAKLAAKSNVKLTVDAEEADRLELSLIVFEHVARTVDLSSWSGFGLAIQAYGKRARQVIAWTAALATELECRFMVRLVKGAYWDAEIKHAQELGLADFPVFTRKSSTDLSYLVCAQDMLAHSHVLFCQFATHNAHTIAAIMHIGKDKQDEFEFQRLHGMGEAIYSVAQSTFKSFPSVRIYAPVGGHKDLLAYLVRRLLENGANSSFVNRFMDRDVPAIEVVKDPVRTTRNLTEIPHDKIPLPAQIFTKPGATFSRENSVGIDLTSPLGIASILASHTAIYEARLSAHPLIHGVEDFASVKSYLIHNPADPKDEIGQAIPTDPSLIAPAFEKAKTAQPDWNAMGGEARAAILDRAANMLQERSTRLISILTREAGKTCDDAIAEVREAVDFCRYYARHAAAEFTHPESLPGPSGEDNSIQLCGRGVFVTISPWNFPLAIFIGQTVAALAAGNSVLAKPAPQTPFIAFEAVQTLHEAGVPRDVLALILGDADIGGALIEHADVAGVAFTGSTKTAKLINLSLAKKDGPIVPLIAETGGQNVMFVDSTALLEQVTDDIIQSAFKSAGQRCSALRVLYLQDEIADDAINMIKGAMQTLVVGDPKHLETDIGPIIDQSAAQSLEDHIETLLAKDAPGFQLPLPNLELGGNFVAPSFFEISNIHDLDQEHFGPILHIIRYKSAELEAALDSAFSTGFGLTLGVHTRMDRRWIEIFQKAPVGNTYVNRNMTGAVVGSQPFGGHGLSGTGFKAGGPRYLYKFATEKTLTVNTMASGGNTDLLTLG